jgi:hypothetical protein
LGVRLGMGRGAHIRWLLLCASVLVPSAASARKQTDLRYPFEQVWNAALRMVRVDMRMPVTDRDADAGYLLFEYLEHGKRYAGSLELVRGERAERPITKTVIQVQGMPGYVEQMLLDKLQRKLRDEFGEPLEPAKPKPEPKPRPGQKPDPKPDEGGEGSEAPAEPN